MPSITYEEADWCGYLRETVDGTPVRVVTDKSKAYKYLLGYFGGEMPEGFTHWLLYVQPPTVFLLTSPMLGSPEVWFKPKGVGR